MSIVIPTQYEDIVDEIVKFIDLPLEEVKSRAWQESLQLGWNVVQDATELTPYKCTKYT
jgi:hypothetical protein